MVPGSGRRLTFGGGSSITIAPGARVVSDPVRLTVRDLGYLFISHDLAVVNLEAPIAAVETSALSSRNARRVAPRLSPPRALRDRVAAR